MAKPRCKRCRQGEPHEFTHGRGGYNYHACRCDVCTTEAVDAAVDRARQRRLTDPEWAAAQREYMRDYHSRTKDAQMVRRREYRKAWRRRNAAELNREDRARRATDNQYRAKRAKQLRDSRALQDADQQRERNRQYRNNRRDQACAEMRDWRERNADYRASYARAYDDRRQSAITPSRTRAERWTAEEDRIAATPGITPLEVAHLTGRSWHASRRRVSRFRKLVAS